MLAQGLLISGPRCSQNVIFSKWTKSFFFKLLEGCLVTIRLLYFASRIVHCVHIHKSDVGIEIDNQRTTFDRINVAQDNERVGSKQQKTRLLEEITKSELAEI